MSTVFIRHPVQSYEKWRPYFDEDRERRARAGLGEVGVFRNADDPNDVLIVFSGDRTGVTEMLADKGLKEVMDKAGVKSPPQAFVAD
jgi:hypothetical protein